jgi:hypothetical protein
MKTPTLVSFLAAFAAATALGPAAEAAPQERTQPAAGDRIVALPLDSGKIILPGLSEEVQSSDMALDIVLNRARNRVGGLVSACHAATSAAPRRRRSCQDILFRFPGLRYDAPRKAVLLGEEIVARDRGFWRGGWKLEAGFAPEFRLVKKSEDNGFEQTTQQFLELALVRKAQAASP